MSAIDAYAPPVPRGTSASPRPRVGALVDDSLPGHNAGGAIRTAAHMAAQVADELEFRTGE